jgi:hypothetical protein
MSCPDLQRRNNTDYMPLDAFKVAVADTFWKAIKAVGRGVIGQVVTYGNGLIPNEDRSYCRST